MGVPLSHTMPRGLRLVGVAFTVGYMREAEINGCAERCKYAEGAVAMDSALWHGKALQELGRVTTGAGSFKGTEILHLLKQGIRCLREREWRRKKSIWHRILYNW